MADSAELGRVLDRGRLNASDGPRALLRIEAPAEDLERGGSLEVRVPKLLTCARCAGGGCDGCECSGALSTPRDPEARRVRAMLAPGSPAGVALRLVRPFGDAAAIDQLIVELRPGARSDSIIRFDPPELEAPPRQSDLPPASREPPAPLAPQAMLGLALIAAALLGALVLAAAAR